MEGLKLSAADVVAEGCLLYAWTPEHILGMPAIRFFALLTAGRKLYSKREAWRTIQAIDAASVSLGDSKYFEELRRYYLQLATGPEVTAEQARSRALDPTSEEAKMLVTDIFNQAERFV